MKHKYLECCCNSMEHILRLSYFADEPDYIYIEFYLNQYPWYKRVWIAIKYIFGYRSKFGEFGEFIFTSEKAKEFKDFLAKFLAK